jgi:hypothetical protein
MFPHDKCNLWLRGAIKPCGNGRYRGIDLS